MKLWQKIQSITYPIILTFFVWIIFQAGYFSQEKTPGQSKDFFCKAISDFNQCLIMSNIVNYINGKHFNSDLGTLNYCHNHLLYADPDAMLKLPVKDKNKIMKVLSIPINEWKSILENLNICEESEEKGDNQFLYMRARCYTIASYKILKYCY